MDDWSDVISLLGCVKFNHIKSTYEWEAVYVSGFSCVGGYGQSPEEALKHLYTKWKQSKTEPKACEDCKETGLVDPDAKKMQYCQTCKGFGKIEVYPGQFLDIAMFK